MDGRFQRMIIGALFLAAVGGICFFGIGLAIFAFSPMHGPNRADAVIVVEKGHGPHELTRLLVSQGIIPQKDEARFVLFGRVTRLWKKVKAGEYKFSAEMTPLEAFRVLISGISVPHPLTVREGENMYEIGDDLQKMGLLNKARFLAICRDSAFIGSLGFKDPKPQSLEGYLFPDTYYLNKTMTGEDIARGMYRRFLMIWGPAERARAKELGMTRHQIITLASIIEKETELPNERALISSVFYNRLRKGMKLQSDPTSIYGIWDRYRGNITKADLTAENPYNTYFVPGLPVGPISNPGRDSIQAALYPAQSDYLYFVSHNDGTHEFTKTYQDHLNAVRKFQLDPRAREGKSWRDLYKKQQATRAGGA